jgi:hypothetical protein
LKPSIYHTGDLNITPIVKQWKTSVYEQWEGSPTDNNVIFFYKKRNELDTFVYETIPREIYEWNGDKELFPQAKDPSNLLSKLNIPENQAYLHNNLSYMLGGYQGQQQHGPPNLYLQLDPHPPAPVAAPLDPIGHLSEGGAPSK